MNVESSSPGSGSSRRSASGVRRRGRRSLAGKSGIGADHAVRRHRLRDQVRRRGEGLRPDAFDREARGARRTIASSSFGVVAAQLAMEDVGPQHRRDERASGSARTSARAWAACATIEQTLRGAASRRARGAASRRTSCPTIIVNMAPGLVSIRFGLQGAEHVARVGLLDGRALDRRGDARDPARRRRRACSRAAAEATITPLGVGGFNAMRALSTRNDEPAAGVAGRSTRTATAS